MCITSSPASLTSTYVYVGDAKHPITGKYVHVLAYQNKAKNKHSGPNSMLLPIPATSLSSENALGAKESPDFLKGLWSSVSSLFEERSLSRGGPNSKVEVFQTGSYTVALAKTSADLIHAISALPSKVRPALNRALVESFSQNYPDWPIAVCAWDGNIEPEPLVWWYEPLDPSKVFTPALDAHNGKAPVKNADVRRDHHLMVGSTIQPFGISSKPTISSALSPYISDAIWGVYNKGSDFNRDYFVSVEEMRGLKPPIKDQRFRSSDPNLWDLKFEYF